jgi:hypothetical protein
MCIAVLNKAKGRDITAEEFQTMWENNKDGGGMMTAINGRLIIEKDLKDWKRLYRIYKDWRSKSPKSNIVLHFRIATSGGVNAANCHPFAINKDLGFVHNGMININCMIGRSDTNTFNEAILKHLPKGFYKNVGIKHLLAERIGHSKLIFLHSDNSYSIVKPELGHEADGNWFSNDSYKPSKYYDFGGYKIAKNPSKMGGSQVSYDWRDEWFGDDRNIADDTAHVEIDFESQCDECRGEVTSKEGKYYGYCDNCLRDYGLLPTAQKEFNFKTNKK